MGSWDNQQIAAASLGLALVVFFAGTTAAIAAGASPPTPLWAAGGAVSGGLLGLLLPGPVPNKVRDAAIDAKTKDLTARARTAGETRSTPAPAPDPVVEAAAKSISWTTVIVLGVVFVLLLILSIVLAAGAIVPPSDFGVGSIQNLTKTLIAMTSAAGTGMIGLLVPSPSHG